MAEPFGPMETLPAVVLSRPVGGGGSADVRAHDLCNAKDSAVGDCPFFRWAEPQFDEDGTHATLEFANGGTKKKQGRCPASNVPDPIISSNLWGLGVVSWTGVAALDRAVGCSSHRLGPTRRDTHVTDIGGHD